MRAVSSCTTPEHVRIAQDTKRKKKKVNHLSTVTVKIRKILCTLLRVTLLPHVWTASASLSFSFPLSQKTYNLLLLQCHLHSRQISVILATVFYEPVQRRILTFRDPNLKPVFRREVSYHRAPPGQTFPVVNHFYKPTKCT